MKSNGNKILIISLIVLIVIIAIVSIVGMIIFKHQPEILQGQIECTNVKISGKLSGRVHQLYVSEGEMVKNGDTLVYIKSPEVDAMLQSANAMENVAKLQNQKIDAGTRNQIINALKQAWEGAKANADLAQVTKKRIDKLFDEGVATPQRKDEADALAKAAAAAAQAAYYQYQLAVDGAQKEDKESSKALINAAQGNVNQVQSILNDSKLISPANGQISSIYPSEGELIVTGAPIMNIVILDSCHVVLNVRENLLPMFYIGSEFEGKVPAIGSDATIKFQTYYISPLGSFSTWRSTKQVGSYDIVTFQVKAKPVQGDNISRLRPGMSVLITVK